MNPHSASPPQSIMDMSLWISNTSTNILYKLISDMETKMISDIHLLHNERKIKHKHKATYIQPSHLIFNSEIFLNNFQREFRLEISNLTKNNKTNLTINMNKMKQNPHLFSMIIKTPQHTIYSPKDILQISSHQQIFHQLKNLQNDIIFIDTETDGISTYSSNLLSICLTTITLNENPLTSPNPTEYLFYIKPHNKYKVDTNGQAFKVNKISQKILDEKGKPLSSISPTIIHLLTNKIVVGFNINSFDIPIIRNNLKRININLPPLMTIDLYQAHHKLVKHDLNTALKDLHCFPIPQNKQHTANGDTDACIRLLAALTKELNLPLTKNTYISTQKSTNKHDIFHTHV
jgi:uncharacterized protein YprB with RNaseH-like and TPR domain